MQKIIDTHTHLTDEVFDEDREKVIDRAWVGGLWSIIDIACQKDLWDKALEISKRHAAIYTALGIHPHEAKTAQESDFNRLKILSRDGNCVGIGEAGLDYYYNLSPHDLQREVFEKHIDIALELNKPLVVHCRDAYDDMIEIFKGYKHLPQGVIHSFDGTLEQAKIFIDMGFFIGICTTITFENYGAFRENISKLDINRFVVETDCPYRSPVPYRGKRSEPVYVVEVAKMLAKVMSRDESEIEKITTNNAVKLFL
jgi:TatD DNase family protein